MGDVRKIALVISERYLKRVIDHFLLYGNLAMKPGGGWLIRIAGCAFDLHEYAIWGPRGSTMVEYTLIGDYWTLKAIDAPTGPPSYGRKLFLGPTTGDEEIIEDSLRGFSWER